MPAANTVHIDRLATMVAEAHRNSLTEYVHDLVAPPHKVDHKTDSYPDWPLETFFRRPTKRAAGLRRAPTTDFVRRDYAVGTATYSTDQFGVEHPLDDTTKKNADAAFRVQQIPIELLTEDIMRERELRVKTLVTDTAVVTQNATLAGTDRWEDASSDIIDQFETGFASVKTNGGKLVNLVVIPFAAFRYAKHHPQLIGRAAQKDRTAMTVTIDMLKEIFVGSIDPNCKFIVPTPVYDAAAEGVAAVTLEPIWGKDVVFAYVDPSPQLGRPTFAATPEFMPFAMGKYRDEPKTCDVYRALEDRLERIVEPRLGYVLKTVIS